MLPWQAVLALQLLEKLLPFLDDLLHPAPKQEQPASLPPLRSNPFTVLHEAQTVLAKLDAMVQGAASGHDAGDIPEVR